MTFKVPKMTRRRIGLAFAVAAATDAAQLLLGPLGWAFVDDALDVVAMILTIWALGFHVLLLPTFVIKLIPIADMVPLWTGCVAAVVALRKKAQAEAPPKLENSQRGGAATIDGQPDKPQRRDERRDC